MKRALLATLFCCFLPFAAGPALSQSTDGITLGTRRVVKSQVLQEDRTVYIYLPASYAESRAYRKYPVLYVRDGGKFFESFAGAVQHLAADATPHVPEMIMVTSLRCKELYEKSLALNPQNENTRKSLGALPAE